MTLEAPAILLTGCTGAIGSHILERALNERVGLVYGTFSRPETYSNLRTKLPALEWSRVVPIFADLRSDDAIVALNSALREHRPEVIVHAAAVTSWTKSESALENLNVHGARRIAAWAAENTPGAKFISLSTAYTQRADGRSINSYERTKKRAETIILENFRDRLRIGIVRPSLAIGNSKTGAIARFNGFYPLVRVIALAEVPCLIGDRDYPIDLVPVDWVMDDIAYVNARLDQTREPVFATTAAGTDSLKLHEIADVIMARLNAFVVSRGLPAPPTISVITRRQFDFLMRAAKSWKLERHFEQANRVSVVMAGYLNHCDDPVALVPTRMRTFADGIRATISRCVDFWLSQHAARLSAPRSVEWLEGVGNA